MAEKKKVEKKKAKKTTPVMEHLQGLRLYHQGSTWFGQSTVSENMYTHTKKGVKTNIVEGKSPEEVLKKLGY